MTINDGKLIYTVTMEGELYTNSCFLSFNPGEINAYVCDNPDVIIPDDLILPVVNIKNKVFSMDKCLSKFDATTCELFVKYPDFAIIPDYVFDMEYVLQLNNDNDHYGKLKIFKIGDWAFSMKKSTRVEVQNLTLSDDIVLIGKEAFSPNKITSLTIPNSVEEIGDAVFSNHQGCEGTIKELIIGSGIKKIGTLAFNGQVLESVSIYAYKKDVTIDEYGGLDFLSDNCKGNFDTKESPCIEWING